MTKAKGWNLGTLYKYIKATVFFKMGVLGLGTGQIKHFGFLAKLWHDSFLGVCSKSKKGPCTNNVDMDKRGERVDFSKSHKLWLTILSKVSVCIGEGVKITQNSVHVVCKRPKSCSAYFRFDQIYNV